jgi:hypothetical protein
LGRMFAWYEPKSWVFKTLGVKTQIGGIHEQ